jgi:ubiquinone/menaquinone biosynthesis C-methylase UbiE
MIYLDQAQAFHMKLTPDQSREFWRSQARIHGQSIAASWADKMAVELEIAEISKHLVDGHTVLDVGCANGYSTLRYAEQRRLIVRGLDYIPEMIEEARRRLENTSTLSTVTFDVGDITDLPEPDGHYDRVIVTRVLINLGGEEGQRKALAECARVLKRGGILICSEATVQGWQRLNAFRREWELPDIPMPPFNDYVDQDVLPRLAAPRLTLLCVSDFASTYFVGTRVLKPLVAKALDIDMDLVDPDAEWNRFFASLPACGDYGTQKCFVFEKGEL